MRQLQSASFPFSRPTHLGLLVSLRLDPFPLCLERRESRLDVLVFRVVVHHDDFVLLSFVRIDVHRCYRGRSSCFFTSVVNRVSISRSWRLGGALAGEIEGLTKLIWVEAGGEGLVNGWDE